MGWNDVGARHHVSIVLFSRTYWDDTMQLPDHDSFRRDADGNSICFLFFFCIVLFGVFYLYLFTWQVDCIKISTKW